MHEISVLAIGNQVKYFPNPTADILDLQWYNNEPITEIQLFDSSGREIYTNWSYFCTDNASNVSLGKLAQGNYFIRIFTTTSYETIQISKQ
jgi:hypothetical protein